MTTHYAKKRDLVRAVQWFGEDSASEVNALIAPRTSYHNVETGQLTLGNRHARRGDWILSASGEDLAVIGDDVFRCLYEKVDEKGRAMPTDAEHEAAAQAFVRELDILLVAGLKLSREEHPNIFRDRDSIQRHLRGLLEDHAYTAARRDRRAGPTRRERAGVLAQ